VRGTLVEGLTDGDIWRLDIFEGSEYQRRKVKVRVLQPKNDNVSTEQGMGDLSQKEEDNVEGEEVEAETYIWTAGAHRLEAEEWDFAEFVRDKMKRWVGREAAETDEGFQGRPSINGRPPKRGGRDFKTNKMQKSMMQWQRSMTLQADAARTELFHAN